MIRSTGYQGMTIAGLIWGLCVFHICRFFEEPPYWLSLCAGAAVFLIAFVFRNIHQREIACEGDELVIMDGKNETRIHKDRIRNYSIKRISSLSLQITKQDDEVFSIPIDGYFSESRVVGVLESLGIRKA